MSPFSSVSPRVRARGAVLAATTVVVAGMLAACTAEEPTSASSSVTPEAEVSATPGTTTTTGSAALGPTTGDCDATASTFRSVVSANPDLPDPSLEATCEGESIVVVTNSIPDYVYVATTPGEPNEVVQTFTLPASPVEAADPDPGDVPRLGAIAVAVDGVPIYGPTEGTGGDVLSLEGALSECGSHNGPVDFHMHLFGWAEGVDCLYSADVVTSGEAVLVGWAADGYPIMSGLVCADDACEEMTQLTSSWELTDESAFATDTWAAHSYVEGSGDLDECNGRVDADGQYRYYTTATFPYMIGCYHGEVAEGALPGGGAP
ncbi:YHYH protein [Microbacterium aquimaris]|uniref:YHYH protein n=1 Tax=Microbacterium aquimaris TaxID=459816 RepID=A0ABU5N566_9MICO|nr:YHYH protein [Microbacterium aquimaris]MDZ8161052.1 YHYH protein [Microbacterium aquimaris]